MKKFKYDFERNTEKKYSIINLIIYLFTDYRIRFLFLFRNKKIKIFKILLKRYYRLYGLEIFGNIGEGLYIGHAHNINVNKEAILGNYCNIHKGVTIGQENRGKRKGSPKIGNYVWFGVNSTVVGNINIGNDVLIAPNSYVNCDVPNHSIVIGNPCKIIKKENATECYINNIHNN